MVADRRVRRAVRSTRCTAGRCRRAGHVRRGGTTRYRACWTRYTRRLCWPEPGVSGWRPGPTNPARRNRCRRSDAVAHSSPTRPAEGRPKPFRSHRRRPGTAVRRLCFGPWMQVSTNEYIYSVEPDPIAVRLVTTGLNAGADLIQQRRHVRGRRRRVGHADPQGDVAVDMCARDEAHRSSSSRLRQQDR